MAKQLSSFDTQVPVGGQGAEGMARAGLVRGLLGRRVSFWMLGTLMGMLLFAVSAPSPLYAIYEGMWHFSPITLTAIYAVYMVGSLTAMLIGGRLSDHLGRRLVVAIGLLVQISGMLVFAEARGVADLYIARLLQGLGSGIAIVTISAWLLDLQPPDKPRLGSLIGVVTALAGLGAGALGSGLLIQYAPNPLHLVFWLLIIVFALALALMPVTPDISERKPGWLQSLRPKVSVPEQARSMFAASAPSLVAIWALVGLYLSLGPSLALSLLGTNSRILGALVITAQAGTAAVSATAAQRIEPRRLVVWGSAVLMTGVGITLLGVVIDSLPLLYLGSMLAGAGFGPAYLGIYRSLALLAPPDQRSGLFAAVYLAFYLALSIPTVLAGAAVGRFGLHPTTYGYGILVMGLAVVTTVLVGRKR